MNRIVIVGKIKGTKGLQGYLRVACEIIFNVGDKVVLRRNMRKDLFTIEDVGHEHMLIKLNSIDTIEQAKQFIHADLMILDKDLKNFNITSSEMIGMKIIDKSLGFLGEVNEVIKSPGNDLFSFIYNEKEILIPNIKEFVLLIKREERVIETDLKEVKQFES